MANKNLIFSAIKNPRLPSPPLEYNKLFMDQLEKVLGLYFNQLDNFSSFVANPPSGTTSERPVALGNVRVPIGFMYFDTSLGSGGKPIWYNGTVWKDASGTTV